MKTKAIIAGALSAVLLGLSVNSAAAWGYHRRGYGYGHPYYGHAYYGYRGGYYGPRGYYGGYYGPGPGPVLGLLGAVVVGAATIATAPFAILAGAAHAGSPPPPPPPGYYPPRPGYDGYGGEYGPPPPR